MKKLYEIIYTIVIIVMMISVPLQAQAPRIINFQAKLWDREGNALNGTKDMVFSIYTVAISGGAIWQEPFSKVPIQNGILNILLGSVVPLSDALFAASGRLYLGIKIADDPEMTPRFQITSVPFALQTNFPAGIIVMWSGAIDNIPAGWALCDGKSYPRADGNGNMVSPDLRGRFIAGAGSSDYNVGDTGGEEKVILTIEQMPDAIARHSHAYYDIWWSEGAEYANQIGTKYTSVLGGWGSNASDKQNVGWYQERSTTTVSNIPGDKKHENRPPYYVLAYIIKL